MRLGVGVERDRRQLLLVDADQQRVRAPFSSSGSVAGTPAWARTSSREIRSGSSRSFGPVGPVHASVDPPDQVVDAVAEGLGAPPRRRCAAARRGSAACSTPGRDPGRPAGTSAAIRRSISESSGSPSRSSSRLPNMSRIAARKSAHRLVAATTCRPKVRPRVESCWISISRSSKSARSVLQPSTTRNTSPYPSSARPCARRLTGRSRSSRCRGRGSTSRAGPRCRSPRRRSGSPRPARSGCRRRPRAAARPCRRRCRRRSRARRTGVSCGVVVSAMLATTDRSTVLLPLRGPPTTAMWPAPPLRSTDRVSRRCSRGRSTVPSGTTRPPSARHSRETRPSCGSTARSGISSSRVSGTSSGGSQTWCAAGPWPTMWPTARSSSDSLVAGVDRRPARARARRPARRAAAPRRS